MSVKPHTPAWYDRLAQMQAGYFYPWRSRVAPFNGEDAYRDLLRAHLDTDKPDKDVLDVGCGHGAVALSIATACRSVLAYDRVAPYIALAREAARRQGVTNVRFVCADSSPAANGGRPAIPAGPGSFDLITSRRGPLHWIEDARRVARAGAALIQLTPEASPAPSWNRELPEELRLEDVAPGMPQEPMREAVEDRLARAGLALHSCWTYDVPEALADSEQLYVRLIWGRSPEEVPRFAEVRGTLESIFAGHCGREGLVLRHRRFLWKAEVT